MAKYCFLEGKHDLFTEVCIRGWVSNIRDFPRVKSQEEHTAQVQSECDTLRSEVCCIENEDAYRQIVGSAWSSSYGSNTLVTERDMVMMASVLKGMTYEEALAFVRPKLSSGEAQAEIDRAYSQFQLLTGGK